MNSRFGPPPPAEAALLLHPASLSSTTVSPGSPLSPSIGSPPPQDIEVHRGGSPRRGGFMNQDAAAGETTGPVAPAPTPATVVSASASVSAISTIPIPVQCKTSPPSSSSPQTVREVGTQATWSLSSCKPGFGVEQLRDGSFETYWQSDGQLPHLVNIQFRRKTTIHDVAVYTDFKLDESYTPCKISVRCGTNFNDLQEIEVIELSEPTGWVHIPLKDLNDKLVRTFMVQIAVIANHQQGRDTHLRQIKIHSPVEEKLVTTAELANWTTPDCLQFLNIR